jgi:predicted transport protein
MLENKAEFIVEYNERLNKNLKREGVDWTQSRVVFVSTSFTEYQIQATNFKDIGIELYEVKQFENNLISINPIKKNSSAESIKSIANKNKEFDVVFSEIKVYTEQDHLAAATDEMAELYEKFKNAILNLSDGIEVKPQKLYIAFKKETDNIVCMELQKKRMKIWIGAKKGIVNDSRSLAIDVSNTGHWGTGDYELHVESDKDLEYIMSLIKQIIS